MYDEFERAVTGKPKKGMPVWGWALIAVACLFLFGVVGAGFAAHRVAKKIEQEFSGDWGDELAEELADLELELAGELEGLDSEIADEVSAALAEVRAELKAEFGEDTGALASDLISRIQPRLERLVGDPHVGLAFLQDLGSQEFSEKALREVLEGSLNIRTEDGDLTVDLWRGEDGGSLIIDTPDGEEIQIDLAKQDGGGELVIRTEEKVVRFGAGSAAEGLPGWVPKMRWMPENPKNLFSATSDEGGLGAVSWETDQSPQAILDFYREKLADEGYRLREEHSTRDEGEFGGGFWAENEADGRVVFVAVGEEDGMTKILLGYGAEVF